MADVTGINNFIQNPRSRCALEAQSQMRFIIKFFLSNSAPIKFFIIKSLNCRESEFETLGQR